MHSSSWRTPLLVLLTATVMVALSNGIRQTFGLYLVPMTGQFGWGRETFAFAIALQNLLWGLAQPVTGMIADRYGTGRVVAAGGVLYALGLYLMAEATTPAALVFSNGVVIALGVCATSWAMVFGAVIRVAPARRRSLYLGLAASGGSIGQFVMLPLSQRLISGLGWSEALVTLALVILVIPWLAVVLAGKAAKPSSAGEAANPLQALQQAGRQGRYWLLFWGLFVCGFHVAFISTHLPAYLADMAITSDIAALALALIGLFNVFGSIWWGYMGGRYSKRKALCVIYLLRAGVITLLITLPMSNATVLTFAAGIGFLWLGTVPLTSALVGQMFGVRYLTTLFSVVFLGHQLGAFLGAWLGGMVFDLTGSYDLVWIAAIALGIFAAAVHWPIDERGPEELAQARRLTERLAQQSV